LAETDLITLGVFVIIVGFVLSLIGVLSQAKGKAKVEGGGVFFIGPIPIGFASSERAFYVLLGISVVFMILFIILNYSK